MSEKKLMKKQYEKKMQELQIELVKLQDWVIDKEKKIAIIFEGRDAAGKGGVIKRIAEHLNPRYCKIIALAAPTEREKTQWYFQRYVNHLPASGEIVLFDRSWYNRAGVERVMGFCNEEEYDEFMRSCPMFERMLIRSGTVLIKYWFSVSDEEQLKRFKARLDEPHKRWKLSPMDLESLIRASSRTQRCSIPFKSQGSSREEILSCLGVQSPMIVSVSSFEIGAAGEDDNLVGLLAFFPFFFVPPTDASVAPLLREVDGRTDDDEDGFAPLAMLGLRGNCFVQY